MATKTKVTKTMAKKATEKKTTAKTTASRRRGPTTPMGGPHYLSADERRAKGKALRDIVPRDSQAGWKPQSGRRDPVELTCASNIGRIQQLIPIRFGRMAASPFAFYRGSAALMAADLATTPTSGLRVQACGDAHLMNFGGFATPERNIVFDINDLDETLPAPFEWDVKRLAASMVIAAQHLRFGDSDAARIAIDTAREYRERVADYASMRALEVWYDRIDLQRYEGRAGDDKVVEEARKRMSDRIEAQKKKTVPDHLFPKLVTKEGGRPRINDDPPLVYHPTKKEAPGLESGFREQLALYRASLPEQTRTLFDRFHLFDVAIKVVGVGSVGTMCAVLLFMAADDDPLFLQLKEARASVLEPHAGKSLHVNHGQRVVVGQRLMQSASDIFLGWTHGKNGLDFYIRQLRDMKMSPVIEDMDEGLLRQFGRMCAHALARAHARSGDAAMMAGYMGSGRTFDDAIGEFAVEYADQNMADYRAFLKAIRQKRIEAVAEGSP